MTSADHLSGTDRCAEAIKKINEETDKKLDIVVNIQGDEPTLTADFFPPLLAFFARPEVEALVSTSSPPIACKKASAAAGAPPAAAVPGGVTGSKSEPDDDPFGDSVATSAPSDEFETMEF